MPATLVAEHVEITDPSTPLASVRRLTGSERMVALYASDMPKDFSWSKGVTSQVVVWVAQGVDRLGFEDVYRSGKEAQYYGVLRLAGQAPAEMRRRFPDRKRLDCVERAGAMLTFCLGQEEPVSGYVGNDAFRVYRAYGDDVDEVGV